MTGDGLDHRHSLPSVLTSAVDHTRPWPVSGGDALRSHRPRGLRGRLSAAQRAVRSLGGCEAHAAVVPRRAGDRSGRGSWAARAADVAARRLVTGRAHRRCVAASVRISDSRSAPRPLAASRRACEIRERRSRGGPRRRRRRDRLVPRVRRVHGPCYRLRRRCRCQTRRPTVLPRRRDVRHRRADRLDRRGARDRRRQGRQAEKRRLSRADADHPARDHAQEQAGPGGPP